MNSDRCWDWVDVLTLVSSLMIAAFMATTLLPALVERTAECYVMWMESKSEVCHCRQCDGTAQKEATMEQAA